MEAWSATHLAALPFTLQNTVWERCCCFLSLHLNEAPMESGGGNKKIPDKRNVNRQDAGEQRRKRKAMYKPAIEWLYSVIDFSV